MRALLLALCAFLVPASALAQAAPTQTAPAQAAVPAGKLPDQVTPIAYRIDMTIVPDQERFSGHTEIDFQLKRASDSVYMHGRGLRVTKAVMVTSGGESAASFTQVSPTGLARLDFGRTLPAGRVTVKLDHDAAFGEGNPSGIYRVKVGDDWYSWSQFQSIDARAAFPSFDEPGFKAPFTVSITTKPGFVAASNAPEIGKVEKGALVTHRYAPTEKLPTYLVAFVVGPFVTVESTVPPTAWRKKPLPLRVIATKPNAGKMQFALEESAKIVTLLERYFGQGFPYPKLDQIGSPVMPGAMENAGADIYGDFILLLGPDATTEEKQTFGMVIAHELAHQWFGDLVTPAWWDDIWLNESFANWMGYRIGNEWRPDLNIGVSAIDEAFDAMGLDSLTTGRPIHQRITRDGDIDAAFDQITYGKGGQVVAMIAAYMGDTRFRDGVRLHMKRHLYGNASTDEFFASLADAARDPRVLASLRSFVDQQGVPVVTLRRDGGKLVATQQRYGYLGSEAPPEQWIIPLCIRRAQTKTCTLVDKPSMVVAAPGNGPMMPNAGGWGYYRFDLDPADWDALIATGATLPAGEALALDDSLWASFYAGKGSVARLFAAARAMTAHKDSNVAVDNGKRLAGLVRRGLVSDAALPVYRKLLGGIYAPEVARLGFDPRASAHASDNPDRQKLRHDMVDLLADDARDTGVRAKLIAAADAYLAGDKGALDPGFAQLALSTAVQERGIDFARTLVERGLAGNDQGLRQAALQGITNSGNREVGRWFLDLQDPRLRRQERLFGVMALLGTGGTRDIAADYLLANYDTLIGSAGGIFAARAAGVFGGLCSVAQADTIAAKVRPALAAQGSTLALDRALEAIRACARFKEAKAGEVSAAILAVK